MRSVRKERYRATIPGTAMVSLSFSIHMFHLASVSVPPWSIPRAVVILKENHLRRGACPSPVPIFHSVSFLRDSRTSDTR